jgi:hypothetical protein
MTKIMGSEEFKIVIANGLPITERKSEVCNHHHINTWHLFIACRTGKSSAAMNSEKYWRKTANST